MASPARSGSSFSTVSSSSSRLHSKRLPPRRGQVKAAIFASLFTSILRFLRPANNHQESARSQDGVSTPTGRSDYGDGGHYVLSVRSSPAVGSAVSSVSATPQSTLPLSRSLSYQEGAHNSD